MPQLGQQSQKFFDRARKVMPLGVSSNFRYWSDTETPVVAKAKGAYIYDFDGQRYTDYRLGWGPVILGHADDFVNQRVIEAIQGGVTFAATQYYEVSVAERIIAMCPGVEMVRLANTGSEATMHALRLARGYTNREVILKFEGCYHGAHDHVLWSTINADLEQVGSRQRPVAFKQSLGVPEVMRSLIQLCPWNNVEILGDILQRRGHEIAAIIVEPVLGNGAALMPQPGYLEFLRAQCDQHGIVLIFDQVKTGFRLAPGGAGEYFGVYPDISTFAKAMGNGYPVAALGGKREVMMTLTPGKVFQGGTYTGNVLSTAAADATLACIQSGRPFAQLNRVGGMLMRGLSEILNRHGIAHHLHGSPAMFGLTFSETKPRDWRDLRRGDRELYQKIGLYLIEHGIMPEPDSLEPWFLSAAHTEADAAEALQVFEDGLRQAL